jgi:hypothetical protein
LNSGILTKKHVKENLQNSKFLIGLMDGWLGSVHPCPAISRGYIALDQN